MSRLLPRDRHRQSTSDRYTTSGASSQKSSLLSFDTAMRNVHKTHGHENLWVTFVDAMNPLALWRDTGLQIPRRWGG